MIKKKIRFIFIILLLGLINFKSFSQEKVFIVYNVNNEIITNIDVEKESRYLIALNVQLKNLSKNKIIEISKESILRERIKKIELVKYFDLSEKNPGIENYIKNFYLKLKLNNQSDFQNYLKNYDLTLDYVEKKIQVEIAWNQLIYENYKNQINIDKKKLKNEIKKKENVNTEKVYLLSEIIFEKNNQENIEKRISNINQSIREIGFENTANIYSVSDSAKFGGSIGWVEEDKLSNKISKKITKLNIGEHTLPIQVGSSFLILKIEEIKYEKKLINKKEELNRKINSETSRQLDQFSKIYYNKIKINTNINEL